MQTGALSLPEIPAIDQRPREALRAKVDGKAKPPGSLGRIEDLAIRLGLIQGTTEPRAQRATLLVFAGDHGLTEEGVSAYPQTVTAAMVRTFLAGRGTANAFARAVGAELRVVDAGVASDLPVHPDLIDRKIRRGTRNAARGPAMTAGELEAALSAGAELAAEVGADVIVLGEMGIGNTASASLLMHRLLPAALDTCIGAGAGHDPAGLARKRDALARAAGRTDATTPLEVLVEFGGYEIAMMAGAILGAASRRRAVLVDGFIVSAAALAAIRLDPAVRDYCIFAHCSAERGHAALLEGIAADPLLDLGLRLGEGTGGLLALPLLRAACGLLNEVASLDEVLSGAV
jgi:nicotinate-nucleotide--dimethylbenzimidazole phosphoribosyltransferase